MPCSHGDLLFGLEVTKVVRRKWPQQPPHQFEPRFLGFLRDYACHLVLSQVHVPIFMKTLGAYAIVSPFPRFPFPRFHLPVLTHGPKMLHEKFQK